MDSVTIKKLRKLEVQLEKGQSSKAIAHAAKILKGPATTEVFAAVYEMVANAGHYQFVANSLRKELSKDVDILMNLQAYADLVKKQLLDGAAGADSDLQWIAAYIKKLMPRASNVPGLVHSLALRMGYEMDSPRNLVVTILEKFLWPLMKEMLRQGDVSNALALEPWAYDVYVKQCEDERAFGEFMSRISKEMRSAGALMRKKDGSSDYSGFFLTDSIPHKVAFVVHRSSMLAHITCMLGFFSGLRELESPIIQPVVFSLAGEDPQMSSECKKSAVKLISLDSYKNDVAVQMAELKTVISNEGCDAAVWLCLPNWMSYAFSYRIAPVQFWWSMKFRNYFSPDIDGYLSGTIAYPTNNEDNWLGGFLAVDSLFDAQKTPQADAIRANFSGKAILGTMARAELINKKEFLSALVGILKKNPNMIYLWTGKKADSTIANAFINAGVANQTKYIGWVDTKVYAQVFDIYLDVFGHGSGFALLEAMAAEKPVVFLDGKSAFSYLDVIRIMASKGWIQLSADDHELLSSLAASDIASYCTIVNELAGDCEWRDKAGALMRRVSKIFENRALSSSMYQDHITSVMKSRKS